VSKSSRRIFTFVFSLLYHPGSFAFWIMVRFISAIFPMLSIYLFSNIIKLLETGISYSQIIPQVLIILFVLVIDNYTRILSVHKLQYLISNTEFAIHKFMINGLKSDSRDERHASIQAIRNFGEAVRGMLELIRQPGIDSVVSLIVIPTILLFVDFRAFIIEISYILVYYFTDIYTTHKYTRLKDFQDAKTESYYAALVDNNDIELESNAYTRHFYRLCNWGFIEWFSLQNIAVSFYSLSLLYQIYLVSSGQSLLSNLVLVMGYMSQTQTLLNNFSTIKDRLADTQVALTRLAKSDQIAVIDLDDLV